jgi:hypothetical protein
MPYLSGRLPYAAWISRTIIAVVPAVVPNVRNSGGPARATLVISIGQEMTVRPSRAPHSAGKTRRSGQATP